MKDACSWGLGAVGIGPGALATAVVLSVTPVCGLVIYRFVKAAELDGEMIFWRY